MREIARRVGVSEQVLAFGIDPIAPGVSERIRAVEAAEAGGDTAERVRAYHALSRAAAKAARGITS